MDGEGSNKVNSCTDLGGQVGVMDNWDDHRDPEEKPDATPIYGREWSGGEVG